MGRELNLLLDTHIWLWSLDGSTRLAHGHESLIKDGRNRLFLSVASYWEICLKRSIGKIEFSSRILDATSELRISWLPIELRDVEALAELPPYHADPFDRIIVAQAISRNLTLLSTDQKLRAYDAHLDLRVT